MEKKVIAIDCECTTNGYEGSPSAFYRNNSRLVTKYYDGMFLLDERMVLLSLTHYPENHILVGHHLQFDIEYLMRDHPEVPWHKITYWSTDIADYLDSGHQHQFPSLEESCSYYGVSYTKKIDIGAHLKSGRKMEDIPLADLSSYCAEDTVAAYKLYVEQRASIGPKLAQLIIDQSGCIPYLASMALNGFKFDVTKAGASTVGLDADLKDHIDNMKNYVKRWYPAQQELVDELNISANRTASAFLYGTPDKITIGKGKKAKEFLFRNSVYDAPEGVEPNPTLGYPVGDDVLAELNTRAKCAYIQHLRGYRDTNKTINTYLGPLLDRAQFPGTNLRITANIHSTSTRTGRMSCTDPNFQNMPPLIRAMFYEDEPVYEIDFKQLELFAIAELSGDEQLMEDLNEGRDIHYETGKVVFGWTKPSDMSDLDRRTVKSVVFGLAYGGSAGTLSEQADITKEVAQDIIDAFYRRYPEVQEWHALITKRAKEGTYQTGNVHSDGSLEKATRVETSITGRVHIITDSKSPDWLYARTKERYSITPTKVKNYKPQGFAGGDIVKTFSRIFFYLIGGHTSFIRLHNTVHDSLVISSPDLTKELLDRAVVKALAYVKKYYNMQTELQVNVKSTGYYWR